jgi:thiol-disulfide isomerase/thioredoxin
LWFRSKTTDNDLGMSLFSKRVKAQRIRSTGDFEAALASGKPVFVDFWKPDCQPCRTMDGIVNELADEFQDDAVVLKANLAHVPELFAKFKIRSTPTFVLVTPKEGGLHQRFRHSGLIKKDQLVGQILKAVEAG